jgi:hypothetical protein
LHLRIKQSIPNFEGNKLIDKKRLAIASTLINSDKMGYFLSGQFVDLFGDLHVKVIQGDKQLSKLYTSIKHVSWNLWTLETIILRLNWEKWLWTNNKIPESQWMTFAACDIEFFYMKARSIFDHVARLIGFVSDNPEQVKFRSFRALKDWVVKKRNSEIIGLDLAELVRSCDWFDHLKELRESIVHYGAETLVFLEKDRILFQVYSGRNPSILTKEIMFNDNVADFELYGGLYTGYLISYLDEVAEVIRKRSFLQESNINAHSYNMGLKVLAEWINRVLLLLAIN